MPPRLPAPRIFGQLGPLEALPAFPLAQEALQYPILVPPLLALRGRELPGEPAQCVAQAGA